MGIIHPPIFLGWQIIVVCFLPIYFFPFIYWSTINLPCTRLENSDDVNPFPPGISPSGTNSVSTESSDPFNAQNGSPSPPNTSTLPNDANVTSNTLVLRSNEITPPSSGSGDGPTGNSPTSGGAASSAAGSGSGSGQDGGGNGGATNNSLSTQHPFLFEPPARTSRGTEGRTISLKANHFEIRVAKGIWYHYDISISPDKCPRRVNR